MPPSWRTWRTSPASWKHLACNNRRRRTAAYAVVWGHKPAALATRMLRCCEGMAGGLTLRFCLGQEAGLRLLARPACMPGDHARLMQCTWGKHASSLAVARLPGKVLLDERTLVALLARDQWLV